MRTNLKATGAMALVLDYIEQNASDVLVEKINRCGKTMDDCWKYIESCARKKASGNCAMVEDAEVYGWAIHFFEEEGNVDFKMPINSRTYTVHNDTKPKKKPVEKKPETKPEPMLAGQLTLAELFGGTQ